jgi:hypothetical protein
MAGQIAYHLLAQSPATHAPGAITTVVSCLPVLVLGMGAALTHLLRAGAYQADQPGHGTFAGGDWPAGHADRRNGQTDHSEGVTRPGRPTWVSIARIVKPPATQTPAATATDRRSVSA